MGAKEKVLAKGAVMPSNSDSSKSKPYGILQAERATGIVLNVDGTRCVDHKVSVIPADSLDDARRMANTIVTNHPHIECSIRRCDGDEFVELVINEKFPWTSPPIDYPKATKRRWFRFSLRTLFVVVTLCAVLSPFLPRAVAWFFPPKTPFEELMEDLNRQAIANQKMWGEMGPVVYPKYPACQLILEEKPRTESDSQATHQPSTSTE